MEIRGHYIPSQGGGFSELFRVFLELCTRGDAEDKQDRSLPCLVTFWLPQHHPHTDKVLKYPVDLSNFMRWVGCWFYMACLVGIPDRCDW